MTVCTRLIRSFAHNTRNNSDWSDLERELTSLIEDPSKTERLHQQSAKWWDTVCSEMELGKYMAARLDEVNNAPERLMTGSSGAGINEEYAR